MARAALPASRKHREVGPADLALHGVGGEVRPGVVVRLRRVDLRARAAVVTDVGAVLLQRAGDDERGPGEPAGLEVHIGADPDALPLGAPPGLAALRAGHGVDD